MNSRESSKDGSIAEKHQTPGESDLQSSQHFFSRTFQAFRYRDFRLMWLGAFTSTTGTWLQQIAESWVVLSLTDSAFYLGLTAFLGQLPVILFALIGGVAADRIDRRKLLIGSQCVQMFSAFAMTMLLLQDSIQVWHLMVAVVMVGAAQSFGGPAYMALIPSLVERKDLPNAIALNSIQFNLARIIGPLLAGVTLALVGPALCFGLNGFSFVAVIISLCLIRAPFKPKRTKASVLSGLREGIIFFKNRKALWQLSILAFISTFCGVPIITLMPVFARDVFGIGAAGYSTMMAISGAGSVTGALLYASLKDVKNKGKLTLQIQLLLAVFLTVFAVSTNLLLSYVMLFLAGGCLLGLFASINSLAQLNITEDMRGRVMSMFMLAFRGGMPLGSLMAGSIAEQISASFALLVTGICLALSAIGFLISRSQVKEL